MKSSLRPVLAGIALALLVPMSALASGFSVYEQSAAASGRAGAWTAGVDDAAANWYNPAVLAWLEESELQFGINGIFAGYDTELTTSDPEALLRQETTFDAVGHAVTPIHLYYASRISDRVAWGFGINNPYGLVSEWDQLPVTAFFRKGSLVTFVANPNLALRLNDNWAIAAGLDYVYADVRDFSSDVVAPDFGPSGPSFITLGQQNLTGEGDDLGWNAAVSYRGNNVRAGLSYRSALSPEIEGDLTFTPSLIPPFSNSPASAELNLADQAAFGIAWDATDRLELEIDLAWAGWSAFQRLAIEVENQIPGVGDLILRQDWDDTFSYRIGASWQQNETHEWRFGALWDESPIPSDTLRPSIPDSDRWAPTIGYGYTGDRWQIDVYYMYLVFTDNEARGQIVEGVIDGTYSSSGHITGITLGYRM